MQSTCKSEIEHLAKKKFGYPATVSEFGSRNDGVVTKWFALTLILGTGATQVVGCRRELVELIPLIERGSAMERLANAKERPDGSRDSPRVLEDSSELVRG